MPTIHVFCLINSAKFKDIQFTVRYEKEKQQTLTIEKHQNQIMFGIFALQKWLKQLIHYLNSCYIIEGHIVPFYCMQFYLFFWMLPYF